jgi:hypothetical protein
MPIYTLVSLLLGIVGATYAASNAIRIHFDDVIKKAVDGSSNKKVGQYSVNDATLPTVRTTQNWIKFWSWVWLGSNIAPALLLNLFVYVIVWNTVWQWDVVVVNDPLKLSGTPWCYAKTFVIIGAGTSLLSILSSFLSIWKTKLNSNALESLLVAGGIKPPVETGDLKPPV